MAVFTSISFDELSIWLKQFNLSNLIDFQGISSGVTNTNYLITVEDAKFILTIFCHSKTHARVFSLGGATVKYNSICTFTRHSCSN